MICQEIERFYPEHREKVRVVYNGYDPVVFLPPRESITVLRESPGLPAAEALAFGFPVINTQNNGVAEVLAQTHDRSL